jgi:hypothetical protein
VFDLKDEGLHALISNLRPEISDPGFQGRGL